LSTYPDYSYPITLERQDIEQLIPHRGAIAAALHLVINNAHEYRGIARWSFDNPIIEGHFPGMPIVPGVLLIEATAQLAGAGLLRGDPYVGTLSDDSVGVLAGVRNCWFKQPVLPDTDVAFHLHCRQMAPLLVQVNARALVDDQEAGRFEVLIAYAPRERLFAPPVTG